MAGSCQNYVSTLRFTRKEGRNKLFNLRTQSTHFFEVDEAPSLGSHSLCYGLSERSPMVDPLSCFSFQPVLHDWCNKERGLCYHVSGMVHIQESQLERAGILSHCLNGPHRMFHNI